MIFSREALKEKSLLLALSAALFVIEMHVGRMMLTGPAVDPHHLLRYLTLFWVIALLFCIGLRSATGAPFKAILLNAFVLGLSFHTFLTQMLLKEANWFIDPAIWAETEHLKELFYRYYNILFYGFSAMSALLAYWAISSLIAGIINKKGNHLAGKVDPRFFLPHLFLAALPFWLQNVSTTEKLILGLLYSLTLLIFISFRMGVGKIGARSLTAWRWISSEERFPASLFLLAFLLRFAFASKNDFGVGHMGADGYTYLRWASHLAYTGNFGGEGLGWNSTIWPPGFIFYLAGVFRLLGHDQFYSDLMGSLLGAAACLACYYIARKIFSHGAGIVVGLLSAVWGEILIYSGIYAVESLLILLVPLLALSMIYLLEKRNLSSFALSGIMTGFNMLTKATVIFFPIFFLGWLLITLRKRMILGGFAIYLIATALIILPWTIRNTYFTPEADFVLINSSGTISFALGSNPFATGTYKNLTPEEKRELEEEGIDLYNPISIVKYNLRHLNSYFKLVLSKLDYLWVKHDWPFDFIYFNPYMRFYVMLFFFIGAFLAIKEGGAARGKVLALIAILTYYTVFFMLVIANPRYRIPAVPLFVIFVGYFIYKLIRWSSQEEPTAR